jgi:hypothetical protein
VLANSSPELKKKGGTMPTRSGHACWLQWCDLAGPCSSFGV